MVYNNLRVAFCYSIFKNFFGRTLKPFGLFFWISVAHLLLLALSTHDLGGIAHINSQGLILSILFFSKFHSIFFKVFTLFFSKLNP